jgi:hypothetical protein
MGTIESITAKIPTYSICCCHHTERIFTAIRDFNCMDRSSHSCNCRCNLIFLCKYVFLFILKFCAKPPTVQPSIVSEGNSMHVLCIALGNPVPNVKLYIGGHFVREDKTRHLVTTIHNVTRDMTNVACYADNGE